MHPIPTHRTVVSYDDLAAKYHGLAEVYAAMPCLVDGAAMCRLVVADVSALLDGGPGDLVKLADAAKRTGYSKGHLRRMIKQGHLRTHRRGRTHYVRLTDLRAKRGARLESDPAPAVGDAATAPSTTVTQPDLTTSGDGSTSNPATAVGAAAAETRLDVSTPSGYDPAADARRMAATRGRGRKF